MGLYTSGRTGSSIPTIPTQVRLETILSSSSQSGSISMCSSLAAAVPAIINTHRKFRQLMKLCKIYIRNMHVSQLYAVVYNSCNDYHIKLWIYTYAPTWNVVFVGKADGSKSFRRHGFNYFWYQSSQICLKKPSNFAAFFVNPAAPLIKEFGSIISLEWSSEFVYQQLYFMHYRTCLKYSTNNNKNLIIIILSKTRRGIECDILTFWGRSLKHLW